MDDLNDYILNCISPKHKKITDLIAQENIRQSKCVELIASENYPSDEVRIAEASSFIVKYTEGYPGNRYYGGCGFYDEMESLCIEKWQDVFSTEYHCNVQPHSGSNANFAAYMALCNHGDTILSMSLDAGGHLTHSSPVNFVGKFYNVVTYGQRADGYIDYEEIDEKISRFKPKVIVAGASAYPREINFRVIQDIISEHATESYHPYFMVDMAHIAGLVAAGCHQSPFELADVITTTTQKTLRGPRGGLIFCKPELAKKVDSAVFPGTQGGSLQNVIVAKAIAAREAYSGKFTDYIFQVVENCEEMCERFMDLGYDVVTNGTDTQCFRPGAVSNCSAVVSRILVCC